MADDVATTLAAALRDQGTDVTVEVTGRATVGLSQETWFLEIDGAAAVLRLPTPASGTKAIVTQRAALQAVAGAVPAPAVLHHDDGADNPFGRPFLVMERTAGEVPVAWHDLAEPARSQVAAQAVDVLAALHAVEAPTGDHAGATDLAWYARRLERYAPLPPVLRGGLWWLERHARPPGERAFVHGDFRMGNFVVDGDRLAGVLDWEMAGAGDPLADLAWCFIPVWGLPEVDEPALIARYAAATGRPVDAERLHWHRVLGYVRLAFYMLSGDRAFDGGHSDDFRLAALRAQLPVHLDRMAATIASADVM